MTLRTVEITDVDAGPPRPAEVLGSNAEELLPHTLTGTVLLQVESAVRPCQRRLLQSGVATPLVVDNSESV